MRFIKRLLTGLFIIIALIIAGAYAALQFINVDELKQLAIQKVNEQTDRELVIAGDVSLQLGPKLNVVIDNVSLSNPTWAKNKQLIEAKSITLAANLVPLLKKQVEISQITLDGATVNLESSSEGAKSWEIVLQSDQKEEKQSSDANDSTAQTTTTNAEAEAETKVDLSIDTISVTNSTLAYLDHKTDAAHNVTIADLNIADIKGMLFESATLTGRYNGAAIEANAALNGTLLDLDAAISGNGATVKTNGTVAIADQSFELSVNANAPQLKQLMALAGQKNNDTSPIAITTNLSGTIDMMSFSNLQANYDTMQIDGSGKLNLSKAKPYVSGTFTIPSYAIDREKNTAAPENRNISPAAAATVNSNAVKPSGTAIPVEALDALNADVKLTVGSLRIDKTTLENINADVKLNQRELNISNLSFSTPHGDVTGNAILTGNSDIPSIRLNANTGGLTLASLMKEFAEQSPIANGNIKADINISAIGSTVEAMQKGLSGEIDVYVNDASYTIPKSAQTAARFFDVVTEGNSDKVTVQCMVSKMKLVNGVATSDVLAMKTPTAIITGKGTLDLTKDRMDMVFKAQGSDVVNLSDVIPPLRISGPFNNLAYIPDPAGAVVGLSKLFLGATTGVGLVAVLGEKVTDGLGITAETDPCLQSISEGLAKKEDATQDDPKETYKQLEDNFREKRDLIKQDNKQEFKRLEDDFRSIRDGFLGVLGKD